MAGAMLCDRKDGGGSGGKYTSIRRISMKKEEKIE